MGNFKILCELTANCIDSGKVSNKNLDNVLKSTMHKTDCGYIFKFLFRRRHKEHNEAVYVEGLNSLDHDGWVNEYTEEYPYSQHEDHTETTHTDE
jgi:hypothetical protein